jgi:TRAP-type transport system periplasmic protein
MKSAFLAGAAALVISSIAFVLPAGAADFTARLSLDVQEGNPKHVAAEQFAKAVFDGTQGAVEIKVFANGLLGGEAESAEGIRLGSIQMGVITSSVFATWVPDVQVLDLPFLFRDDAHATAANPVLTERLSEQFTAQGFHLLVFSINGARQPMSKFPIQTPDDVRGKKMRVIQSPVHVALWQAVGANPVPIPAAEVYNSMQTGVVDFFDNTATNYLTFRFHEVAPHYTKLSHVYAMGTWVVSDAWWQKLSAEQQAVVTAAAVDAQAAVVGLNQAADEKALAKTVELGATIHDVADKEAWRSLMQPVWAQFTPNIPNADANIKPINAIE